MSLSSIAPEARIIQDPYYQFNETQAELSDSHALQLPCYHPFEVKPTSEDSELIPRSFYYKKGIDELDLVRPKYKLYKRVLNWTFLASSIYNTAAYLELLPNSKTIRAISVCLAVKEVVSRMIKYWTYFGSVISFFSVFKDQIHTDKIRLIEQLDGKEISLYNDRDERIDAMYFKAPGKTVKGPTILFCNSNAGFLELNGEWVRQYLSRGYNILTFNYPGYAESEGAPSHRACFMAAEVAYQYLHTALEVKNENLLVHGHSIGGPHAAFVASSHPGVHLVVDRSFSDLAAVVRATYGGSLGETLFSLFTDFFNLPTDAYYQKVTGKKWVIQALGNRDKTIPLEVSMAMKAGDIIWHEHNLSDAHKDHLSYSEYKAHFKRVQKAFEKAIG